MIVDCMTCPVRGRRCDECAVTVLSGPRTVERPSPAGPTRPTRPTRPRLAGVTSGLVGVPELRLDAAEHRVVSMFVGAGLVEAGAAARLRARREDVPRRGFERDAG